MAQSGEGPKESHQKFTTALWSKIAKNTEYWATRSSVRSHRSLVRLLRTARFARALRCAHSFARLLTSLTPSLMGK